MHLRSLREDGLGELEASAEKRTHLIGGWTGRLGRETGVQGPMGGKPRDGRTTEATSRREKSWYQVLQMKIEKCGGWTKL